MWKYRCKSHLIAMSVAFVVGLALSAVVFSSGVDLNSDMYKIICGFYILGMPY